MPAQMPGRVKTFGKEEGTPISSVPVVSDVLVNFLHPTVAFSFPAPQVSFEVDLSELLSAKKTKKDKAVSEKKDKRSRRKDVRLSASVTRTTSKPAHT